MSAAPDFWRSRTLWSGIFGILACAAGAVEAVNRGTPPGLAWPVAIGAALKFLQDAFARDATVKGAEKVVEAVREVKAEVKRNGG